MLLVRLVVITTLFFSGVGLFASQLAVAPLAATVKKYHLDNGMTLLVLPMKGRANVAMQMWYNVGSKHENVGERGMAHFIEHMMFKGTHELLSETDLAQLSTKLCAYNNAHTYYDWTYYDFALPKENWTKVLPVFADTMSNCRFLSENMSSELKVIVQEFDQYADNYARVLLVGLICDIFNTHPYHYPVIGFKDDLSKLDRAVLVNFYKKHYIPQHATLVLVGDIDPDRAFKEVKKLFGAIPRGADRPADNFYIEDDMQVRSLKVYRDVEQSQAMLAFVIPGRQEMSTTLPTLVAKILTEGMGARLYKKLVVEKSLVLSVSSYPGGLFEKNLFFIHFVPKKEEEIAQIKEIILQEIQDIVEHGVTPEELNRAQKLLSMSRQNNLEYVSRLADNLGAAYVATGSIESAFDLPENYGEKAVVDFVRHYFKPILCHDGYVLKIPDQDKECLVTKQKKSQALSAALMAQKIRTAELESARYANTVTVSKFERPVFDVPESYVLDNGLRVLLWHNSDFDMVKAEFWHPLSGLHDPEGLEGMNDLRVQMLLRGTKDLPGDKFVQALDGYGIVAGGDVWMRMLPADVRVGLGYLKSILTDGEFDATVFETIKDRTLTSIRRSKDDPHWVRNEVVFDALYPNHPYGRMSTIESVSKITRDACYNFYVQNISPKGACLTVVGNFDPTTIKQTVQDVFGSCSNRELDSIVYPELSKLEPAVTTVPMNRDQLYLGFYGRSVQRLDPDYLFLKLYDQLLVGSAWGSYLVQLRLRTGLFYTIGGSLLTGAGDAPGYFYIKTQVAPDKVVQAQEQILAVMCDAINQVTDEEFERAKELLIYDYKQNYEYLDSKLGIYAFLHRYDLPFNYFEQQVDLLRSMSKSDMQRVVKKYLNRDTISIVCVGNVEAK